MAFNLPVLVERYELFVIISIGEVVAASLASENAPDDSADDDHLRYLSGDDNGHGDEDPFNRNTYILVALIVLEAALIKVSEGSERAGRSKRGGAKRRPKGLGLLHSTR